MANLSTGKGIALIVGLANSIATKKAQQYESIGVTNVVAGPGANQITFTLANGDTYTVSLTFNASGISFTPPTGMTSTTVQTALQELFNDINASVTSLNSMGGDVSLVAGDNISITKNSTAKTLTIAAAGSLANISTFELDEGDITVTYDSTTGAEFNSTGKITHVGGTADEFNSTFNVPVVPGNGISIDATEGDDQLEIKAVAEYITIDSPAASTSGTLTATQLTKLQSSENVHIMFNNELYRMQSKGHTEGYLTYAMNEYESNTTTIKSITVTISTRGWVLHTQDVGAGGGSLADLSDVTIQSVADGDIIKYDSYAQKFKNTGFDLTNMNDTEILSPANNQILVYNSTDAKWENTSADDVVRAVIPPVVTTVPATLAVNTIYSLGTQTTLSLVLPTSSIGNCIEIQFFSGSTAATLSVTSSAIISDFDLVPEANTSYIIFAEWGPLTTTTEGWLLTYSSNTYTE